MAVIRAPTGEESNKIFQPYAIALGELVYAWNHLQDELASLFWRVSTIENGAIPFAIWHSVPSDRTQRQFIRVTAEVSLDGNEEAQKEIVWLLDKVDHLLASTRNDAMHAPLTLLTDQDGTRIVAHNMTNHPRAESLEGKEILATFIWARQTAEILRHYSWQLRHALNPKRPHALPKRPELPRLVPQTKATEKSPAGRGKARRRPHQLRIREV